MRILVNDYAGHPFELQLSRELASLGHTVLHTYFGAYQTPKGNTGSDGQDHLRILAIQIPGSFSQFSAWTRRRADAAYGRVVAAEIDAFTPDVVISANTPIDAQQLILKAARRNNAKFVFWLQDLLSSAVAFVLRRKGLPFAGLAGRVYARIERQLLQKSDAVICIAPEFRSKLESWGIARDKTFVIENWAPLDEIPMLGKATSFREELGMSDRLCFLYSGTLGMKHKPELLLALAHHFSTRPDVEILVVAQGAGSEWLRKEVTLAGITNLRVLPFQPYERHAEVLASADVLITLLDDDCGEFAVPSKLLAYMCAGRPQLVAAPAANLVSKIVQRSGSGVAVSASQEEFLSAADFLAAAEPQRLTYAANARSYAENTFRIEAICDRFLQVFSSTNSRQVAPLAVASAVDVATPTP